MSQIHQEFPARYIPFAEKLASITRLRDCVCLHVLEHNIVQNLCGRKQCLLESRKKKKKALCKVRLLCVADKDSKVGLKEGYCLLAFLPFLWIYLNNFKQTRPQGDFIPNLSICSCRQNQETQAAWLVRACLCVCVCMCVFSYSTCTVCVRGSIACPRIHETETRWVGKAGRWGSNREDLE